MARIDGRYGFLRLRNSRLEGNELLADISVCKWHPAWWWLLAKAFFRSLAGVEK